VDRQGNWRGYEESKQISHRTLQQSKKERRRKRRKSAKKQSRKRITELSNLSRFPLIDANSIDYGFPYSINTDYVIFEIVGTSHGCACCLGYSRTTSVLLSPVYLMARGKIHHGWIHRGIR
jgi:hypothetical protein